MEIRKLILLLTLTVLTKYGFAQIVTAQNGDWSVASTWVGGSVPLGW